MNRHANVIGSFGSAWRGVEYGLHGRSLRIQLVVGVLILALAFWFQVSVGEWLGLIVCILAVLALELINTAIEELSDVLIKEHHPGIAKVKELASAAVLIASLAAGAVGVYIFLPYLLNL